MKFSIVLIFLLSSTLMADTLGMHRVKNNPFFTASASLIAVGKRVRDLLWQRSDAMNEGLSGADKIDAIDSEIDELADLTEGTFSGFIETSSKASSLKSRPSTGNELQDQNSPKKTGKPSDSDSSSNSNSDGAQTPENSSISNGNDDDDDDTAQSSQTSRSAYRTPPQFRSPPRSRTNSFGSGAHPYSVAAAAQSSDNSGNCNTPSRSPKCRPLKRFNLKSVAESILSIQRGYGMIHQQRLIPLRLKPAYWPETAPDHIYLGARETADAFKTWLADSEEKKSFVSSPKAPRELPSVSYLTPNERQQRMFLPNNLPTNFTGIFVIGPDRNLYLGTQVKGRFHHSSFFAGGAIIWAGTIETNSEGQIIELSDESGHYQPTDLDNLQGLCVLQKRGFDLSKANFTQSFRNGCSFTTMERSMSINEYIALIGQEIAKSSASQAQNAGAAAAAASGPTQDEIAK